MCKVGLGVFAPEIKPVLILDACPSLQLQERQMTEHSLSLLFI